jgi:hypothetical protein
MNDDSRKMLKEHERVIIGGVRYRVVSVNPCGATVKTAKSGVFGAGLPKENTLIISAYSQLKRW